MKFKALNVILSKKREKRKKRKEKSEEKKLSLVNDVKLYLHPPNERKKKEKWKATRGEKRRKKINL